MPKWPFYSSDAIIRSIDPTTRVFAKVDLTSGYRQIELWLEDRDLMTFILPFGKYRYTMLPMGLSPSGDGFNRPTDRAIVGWPGIKKSIEDMLVWASNNRILEERLDGLFTRICSHSIKVSVKKYTVGSEIEFEEFFIRGSGDGIQICPDPEKILAALAMETPETKREYRSFYDFHISWRPGLQD